MRFRDEFKINGSRPFHEGHKSTWSEISSKPTSFTPASHTHDDRYFTESECNTKLATKVGKESGADQWLMGIRTGNLNDINIKTGFKYADEDATGRPSGVDHAVMTMAYDNIWKTQLAQDWRTNKAYIRTSNNGTWNSWSEIFHEGHLPTWTEIASKPSTFTPASHTHTYRDFGISNTDPTLGKGISLYGGANNAQPNYGFMFAGTGTFGTHGDVVGDWATYLTMTGTHNRGWIFKHGSTNVASISATGALVCHDKIIAHAYKKSTNKPALLIDKMGTGYLGIGAMGVTNEICYGKTDDTNNWNSTHGDLKHHFKGTSIKHNDCEISHKHSANLQGGKWRRILQVDSHDIGVSGILSISGTAANLVVNNIYAISSGHPGKGNVTQLTSTGYNTLSVRVLSTIDGSMMVDVKVLEAGAGLAPVYVTFNKASGGTVAGLNQEVSASIPSGYVEDGVINAHIGFAANRFALVSKYGKRAIEYHTTPIGDGDVGGQWLEFFDAGGTSRGKIGQPNTSSNALHLSSNSYVAFETEYTIVNPHANGGIIADYNGFFRPSINSRWDIGHPAYRVGVVYYTSLNAPSDKNKKENIQYIDSPIRAARMTVNSEIVDAISQKDMYDFIKDDIRLANYDYKGFEKDPNDDNKNSAGRDKIGFIAQDIIDTKVGKHLIKRHSKNTKDESLSYDITNYVNILAGALKETILKVEKQDMEIKKLKGRIKNEI